MTVTATGFSGGRRGIGRERPDFALSRREFLAGAGALVVSFALLPRLSARRPRRTPSAGSSREASRTRRCSTPGFASTRTERITVFTGKVELGQGIKTALIQLAAEELVVEPGAHRARHRRHRAHARTRATPPAATR